MSTVSSYNLRHVFWWSVFDGDSDLFSIWRRLIDMAWLSHPWFLEVPRNVILQARGNPDVHIILRGSENGPNYGFLAIQSPRVFSPWVSMSLKSFGRWSWPIKLNHPRGALIHLGWNPRHSMYKYGIFTHTRYQNTQKLAECRYIYIYIFKYPIQVSVFELSQIEMFCPSNSPSQRWDFCGRIQRTFGQSWLPPNTRCFFVDGRLNEGCIRPVKARFLNDLAHMNGG